MTLLSTFKISAQEIEIKAEDKPLNQLLIEIRDNYALQLSFDDKSLSEYSITINKAFKSPRAAFAFLLKGLPLTFEKQGEVYLFYPKTLPPPAEKWHKLSGRIRDVENYENLPFTHIVINGLGSITDERGNFNFESKTDSIFNVKVSHLGYHLLDTTVQAGVGQVLDLQSAAVNIAEVMVKGAPIVFSSQNGSKAGMMRINHQVAKLIPGNGDNSVFNLLRLQPGVMAAGEQSSDMVIWGSYEGQTQVNFDGITIFGLKNYNDNISAVNPYMAKDIRIHKGGYDATKGERVGGIVDITGIDGKTKTAGLSMNLNNMTMNLMTGTPIGENLSVVGAFRHTYYQLYQPGDIQISDRQTADGLTAERLVVEPDYFFRDGNLKFSGKTNSGDTYHLSSFGGQDKFSYTIEQDVKGKNVNITSNLREENLQYGVSGRYNKLWAGKGSSELTVAYSALKAEENEEHRVENIRKGTKISKKDDAVTNKIGELKMNLSNKIRINEKHELEFGGGYVRNDILLQIDTFGELRYRNDKRASQVVTFLQDRFSVNKYLTLNYGLRNDFSVEQKRSFLQPRLGIVVKPTERIRINGAWGVYRQFITLEAEIDPNGNYNYHWLAADDKGVPIMKSQHFVSGISYANGGFMCSVEGYFKQTKGVTKTVDQFVELENQDGPIGNNGSLPIFRRKREQLAGDSKAMGLDFFVKQEYRGHSFWISYSLSQTLEWFPDFPDEEYRPAFHDQRHELKFAGVVDLSPFYISANYVYGSGFKLEDSETGEEETYPYSRLDVAGVYRFRLKKMKFEAGVSILNVLDRENIKYANFIRVPTDDTQTVGIHTEAVPFTPTLFLNVAF